MTYSQTYHLKNRAKRCASARRWYAENREQALEKDRQRYAANPEKYRELARQHRLLSPEKVRESDQRWKSANPAKRREYKLRRKYGISEADFQRLLAKQKGLCAVCESAPGTDVDHNHVTGKVRGILCPKCNKALGLFKDSSFVLAKAIFYLNGHET